MHMLLTLIKSHQAILYCWSTAAVVSDVVKEKKHKSSTSISPSHTLRNVFLYILCTQSPMWQDFFCIHFGFKKIKTKCHIRLCVGSVRVQETFLPTHFPYSSLSLSQMAFLRKLLLGLSEIASVDHHSKPAYGWTYEKNKLWLILYYLVQELIKINRK